jgi:hypothetical protein
MKTVERISHAITNQTAPFKVSRRRESLEFLFMAFLEEGSSREQALMCRILQAWESNSDVKLGAAIKIATSAVDVVPMEPEPTKQRLTLAGAIDPTPEQEKAARAELLASIVNPLAEMPNHMLRDIAQFLDICRNASGSTTPAEEFILNLVIVHYMRGLTPEIAADAIEEFRANYDDLREAMKRFNAIYRKSI